MAKNKQTNKPSQMQPIAAQAEKKTAVAVHGAVKGLNEKWLPFILIIVAFIVNARTISFSYTYDDSVFTTEQTLIGLKGLGAIPGLMTHGKNYNFDKSNGESYRPLLPVSFAVEHEIFGFQPHVSHAINLLLFCVLVWVAYQLLRRMFRDYPPYVPFFILLLYELHPIHTEVIANVKSRDEVMAMMFTVMSMIQSFKYVDTDKAKHLLLSGVYFLLALLSKESPICFVAIVPMTLYFFTEASFRKILVAAVPYALMAVVFVVLSTIILDSANTNIQVSVTENSVAGANGFSERMGSALLIQLLYLWLLVFPLHLSYDYSYHQIPYISLTHYWAILTILIVAALLVYAVKNIKRKDIFAYCILFYCISMSLTSNIFIQIGTGMGERLLFFPSLAFCVAVVFLITKLLKVNLSELSFKRPPALVYSLTALAVLYGARTMARNEVWQNNLTLFRSGVITSPNSWRTNSSLGVECQVRMNAATDPQEKKSYLDESLLHYKKAIAIYPYKADTYGELGAVYFSVKMYDSAEVYLRKALALNPRLASAAANLGTVYLTLGRFPDALGYYRTAIEVQPDNIIAMFNLAVCYSNVQKTDSAIITFKRSIAVDPNYFNHKAFEYTAMLYKNTGMLDSAIKYAAIARQFNPGFNP